MTCVAPSCGCGRRRFCVQEPAVSNQSTDRDCLALMSGGADSAACAHLMQSRGWRVKGLFIDYGQPCANSERLAAERVATHLDIELAKHVLPGRAEPRPGEIFARNAFLIVASVFLEEHRRGVVAIGVHAGTSYYDASPVFIERMDTMFAEATDGALAVVAPFETWVKSEIIAYARSNALPLELTYCCEASDGDPCGECPSCRDRAELGY